MYRLEAALTHQINSALMCSLQHAEPESFNERLESSLGQTCITKLRQQQNPNQFQAR